MQAYMEALVRDHTDDSDGLHVTLPTGDVAEVTLQDMDGDEVMVCIQVPIASAHVVLSEALREAAKAAAKRRTQ